MTTIEHRETRKDKPHKANEYTNCYYACRFCNFARSTKPVDANGRHLLDPTTDAWADHFLARDHCLIPTTPDGTYTAEDVYCINDEIRIRIREKRAEYLNRCLNLIHRGSDDVRRLNDVAKVLASSDSANAQHIDWLLAASRERQDEIARARKSIERYRAIPHDCPSICRCKHQDPKLPPEIDRQLLDVHV